MTERYLNENEVSEITGRAVQTLRNERHRGEGIEYSKIGRSVRYALSDVVGFMRVRRIETADSRSLNSNN